MLKLLLTLFVLIGLHPASAAVVQVIGDPGTVSAGDVFSVDINIAGLGDGAAPSLGAFDLTLSFNPAVIQFQSVQFGDPVLGDQLDLFGLGSIVFDLPGADSVRLIEISFDSVADLNTLQEPAFRLAGVQFTAVASGSTGLGLLDVLLSDAEGNPIPTGAAIPEPGSMHLLASGAAAMIVVARLVQNVNGSAARAADREKEYWTS